VLQDFAGFDQWDPGESSLTQLDPEAFRPLAAAVPELELAFEARDIAKDMGINPDVPSVAGFFPWLAHGAALTERENYEGLPAALGLAYYYLWPPIRALWTIEQQFSGVLDAAYKFLTSGGKAIAGAENALAAGGATIAKDLGLAANEFEHLTGWA